MAEYISNTWKNKKIRIVLPFFHFLLSFIYERRIFIFHLDKNVVTAIPINNIISDKAERVFGYISMKFFAFLFIMALWQIIWFAKDNIKKTFVKLLILTFLILTLVYLGVYPYIYDQTWDAHVTYSYAIRFWPEYWHSAYSSIVYGGLLMTIPSPAGMCVLQILYSFSAVGYLYNRILSSHVLKGRGRHFIWLLLLIPLKDNIVYSPYRTNQYTILSLFFISVLVMDIIDKKERKVPDIVMIVALAAFFSVWRTEGIIIGTLAIVTSIIFVYGKNNKMKLAYIGLYVVATLLVMIPQKLGDIKYYGNDYEFINSFPTIYNILNDTSHNLSYEGVDEDLEAIDKVVPLELVTKYGMDGYRRYNYANGRADINQSMAGKTVSENYNRAYINLIKHNFGIYAKTQLTAMGTALGIYNDTYEATYTGDETEEYPKWYFVGWDNGREDLFSIPRVEKWMVNIKRQKMLVSYLKVTEVINTISEAIFFKAIGCMTILLMTIGIIFTEIVNSCRKRINELPLAIILVAVLGQLFAIMLVMPDDNTAYLQPSLCCSMVTIICYFASKHNIRKK